jgi:glutamyl-tRNA synthetase
VSFLATLGWHDGTDQEIFTIKELVKKFSLSRVQHGGAHFDDRRLTWVNGYFIRAKPLDELYNLSKDFWPKSANSADADYKKAVLSLVQERLKCLGELPELTSFFFEDLPIDTSLLTRTGQLSKLTSEERLKLLKNTIDQLKKSDFTVEDLTKKLNDLLVITGQKPGILFSLIRIATTWAPASPGLAETLSVLGRDTSLSRLKHAVSVLAM